MGDFIVGGKWYLLEGWVASLKGSDPEVYKKKKSVLKTKSSFRTSSKDGVWFLPLISFAFPLCSFSPLHEAARRSGRSSLCCRGFPWYMPAWWALGCRHIVVTPLSIRKSSLGCHELEQALIPLCSSTAVCMPWLEAQQQCHHHPTLPRRWGTVGVLPETSQNGVWVHVQCCLQRTNAGR